MKTKRTRIKEARPSKLRLKYMNLGDFGGTDPITNSWYLEVGGPTFDIKDDLKKMGLRWCRDRKLWGLWATEYQYNHRAANREYGKIRGLQEQVYPKLKAYVKDFNRRVDQENDFKRDLTTSVKDHAFELVTGVLNHKLNDIRVS